MNGKIDFGQFISEQRIKRSIKSQELAEKIGISTAYLSQLEHGVRVNPAADLIFRIAKSLDLNPQESTKLYDLYAKSSGQISPDIALYITENVIVQQAIRQARDANATKEDWKNFIEQLKNEQ